MHKMCDVNGPCLCMYTIVCTWLTEYIHTYILHMLCIRENVLDISAAGDASWTSRYQDRKSIRDTMLDTTDGRQQATLWSPSERCRLIRKYSIMSNKSNSKSAAAGAGAACLACMRICPRAKQTRVQPDTFTCSGKAHSIPNVMQSSFLFARCPQGQRRVGWLVGCLRSCPG